METHILERQRKLILEKSKINTEVNKYLEQLQISKERGDQELGALLDKLENLIGVQFTEEEREQAIKGELEILKEKFQEHELKGTTVFFWNKEKNLPMIGDHMVYGFMKAAAEAITRTRARKNGVIFGSTSYTQSIINQHVRCQERFITFDRDILRNPDGSPQYLQRSLRAQTPQGPRVSLARSEVVPEGAKIRFTLKVLGGSPLQECHIREMFDYGEFTGYGQWRNAGHGAFVYEMMSHGAGK
jgi:hypothetical protein